MQKKKTDPLQEYQELYRNVSGGQRRSVAQVMHLEAQMLAALDKLHKAIHDTSEENQEDLKALSN